MNIIQSMIHEKLGEVRIIKSKYGNPMNTLFCASDVCNVLGYRNSRDTISRHCKGVVKSDTLTNGGLQSMSFIPLYDVFALIYNSKKPEAIEFRDWINMDVLPNLYQFGTYTVQEHINNPQFFNPEYSDTDIDNAVESKDLKHLTSVETTTGEILEFNHNNLVYDILLSMKDMLTPLYNNQQIMYENQQKICNELSTVKQEVDYIKQMIVPATIKE